MQIIETDLRVMRGPNYWSIEHPELIVITLDTKDHDRIDFSALKETLEGVFPDDEKVIAAFGLNKTEIIPSVIHTLCVWLMKKSGSGGEVYSLIDTVKDTSFVHICFEYDDEDVGWQAAKACIEIINSLLNKQHVAVDDEIRKLRIIRHDRFVGPSTSAIINAAVKAGVSVHPLRIADMIVLGTGRYLKRIQASVTDKTGMLSAELARNKEDTKALLHNFFIPVPDGKAVDSLDELKRVAEELKFPLAAKPLHGHHGNGVTTNINSPEDLENAFNKAREFADTVLVEKFIFGNDYRLLVVNHKFVAAAQRIPASVTGDGKSTVLQLVEIENAKPERGEGHENVLTKIIMDDVALRLLKKEGLKPESVPEKGKTIFLKETANLSTGGTAVDVTDDMTPANIEIVERASRLIGLDVCGLDIIAPDLKTPLAGNGGAIVEINAAPGLRMHFSPTSGKSRDVAARIVEYLFPDRSKARIPIVAITGTNGKTTTARLIAHLAGFQAYKTGLTSTDGIYLGDRLIAPGDFAGYKSAEVVLMDPATEFAVLECARGGILRSGLPFDFCDVGIVMNVGSDHLGMKQVFTLDEMARVKSVVAKAVSANGYAVLNAEDHRVFRMAEEVKGHVAFFSLDPDHENIRSHLQHPAAVAASVINNFITIMKKNEQITIGHVNDIPLTFNGQATFNIQNILAATLAAYVLDFEVLNIRNALHYFYPSPAQNPGRMNFFDFGEFEVVVDYAHNPPSIAALGDFFAKLQDKIKTGIITAVGDRRSEDMIELGKVAANAFDKIIIRIDEDTRGRKPEEIAELIEKGISLSGKKVPYELIPSEKEALAHAVKKAGKNEIIIVATEKVNQAIAVVTELQKKVKGLKIEN